MDNDDDHLDIHRKPPELAPAYISLALGGVAALGSVLLVFGISPGFVARHPGEAGFDYFVNHLSYFGPLVALSWFFFCVNTSKSRFVFWNILLTAIWLLGFWIR